MIDDSHIMAMYLVDKACLHIHAEKGVFFFFSNSCISFATASWIRFIFDFLPKDIIKDGMFRSNGGFSSSKNMGKTFIS